MTKGRRLAVSDSRNSRLKRFATAAISTHNSTQIVRARVTKKNQKMEHAKAQVADLESKAAPGTRTQNSRRVGQQCRYACWTSPGIAFTPSDGYPPGPYGTRLWKGPVWRRHDEGRRRRRVNPIPNARSGLHRGCRFTTSQIWPMSFRAVVALAPSV